MNQVQTHANYMTMDQRRNNYLGKVQHRDEILVVSEFDSPFPRLDILPKEVAVILRLQGFGVVNIVGLNPNFARIGDLAIQVIHTGLYTRIQVRLETKSLKLNMLVTYLKCWFKS